jgi:hypothetical protein
VLRVFEPSQFLVNLGKEVGHISTCPHHPQTNGEEINYKNLYHSKYCTGKRERPSMAMKVSGVAETIDRPSQCTRENLLEQILWLIKIRWLVVPGMVMAGLMERPDWW